MTKSLQRTEAQAVIDRAHGLERDIKDCVRATRLVWPSLAQALHDFGEERAWEVLEYPSLEAFLADPDVEIERRTYFRLAALHRELVVKRKVDPKQLQQMSVSRVNEVLPAVTEGRMSVAKALSAAEVTPVRDLRILARDPDAPIDPEKEKQMCPTCHSLVAPEKLPQAPPAAPERCPCGHTPSRHLRYRNPNEGEFWGGCRDCGCSGLVVG